jgi:hypothetical protein
MDERFTEDEYHVLRRYLEKHYGLHVDRSSVAIPMAVKPGSGSVGAGLAEVASASRW